MYSVKEIRSELELWNQYFGDVLCRINEIQEKAGLFSTLHSSRRYALKAQGFLEQFNDQQQLVKGIMEKLTSLDDALHRGDPDAVTGKEHCKEFSATVEEMEDWQHVFLKLKDDYEKQTTTWKGRTSMRDRRN